MAKLLFDIGGTHIRVARSEDGTTFGPVCERHSSADWGVAQGLFAECLDEAAAGSAVESVVGGVAGVLHEGVVQVSPNLAGWAGANVQEFLQTRYPSARIVVENDAAVACVGEAVRGAGKGSRIVVYLTVGTGVGGACCVDGVLEPRSQSFEPGHQVIDVESGHTLEQLASGESIKKRFGTEVQNLTPEQLGEVAQALAAGVHNAVAHWTPDVVVLGGAVIFAAPALLPKIEQELSLLPPLPFALPRVVRAASEHSALEGALVLN